MLVELSKSCHKNKLREIVKNQNGFFYGQADRRGVNPFGQPDRKKAVLVFDDFPKYLTDFKCI